MTRARRASAAATVAVAAVLLSACGSTQAGAAAVVGDVRITETRVNQAAADAAAAASPFPPTRPRGSTPGTFPQANANRLVTSELLAIAAAQEGIVVTQSEVDTLLDQAAGDTSRAEFEAQIAAQTGVPPADLESFARDFIIQQKLGEILAPGADATAKTAAVNARLAQIAEQEGVTVSPRYGAWNAEAARIEGDVNDLSSPQATPEPLAPAAPQ